MGRRLALLKLPLLLILSLQQLLTFNSFWMRLPAVLNSILETRLLLFIGPLIKFKHFLSAHTSPDPCGFGVRSDALAWEWTRFQIRRVLDLIFICTMLNILIGSSGSSCLIFALAPVPGLLFRPISETRQPVVECFYDKGGQMFEMILQIDSNFGRRGKQQKSSPQNREQNKDKPYKLSQAQPTLSYSNYSPRFDSKPTPTTQPSRLANQRLMQVLTLSINPYVSYIYNKMIYLIYPQIVILTLLLQPWPCTRADHPHRPTLIDPSHVSDNPSLSIQLDSASGRVVSRAMDDHRVATLRGDFSVLRLYHQARVTVYEGVQISMGECEHVLGQGQGLHVEQEGMEVRVSYGRVYGEGPRKVVMVYSVVGAEGAGGQKAEGFVGMMRGSAKTGAIGIEQYFLKTEDEENVVYYYEVEQQSHRRGGKQIKIVYASPLHLTREHLAELRQLFKIQAAAGCKQAIPKIFTAKIRTNTRPFSEPNSLNLEL